MSPTRRKRVGYRLWSIPKQPRVVDRSLLFLGTLRAVGWMRSVAERKPVDEHGQAVPWWTYAAIHFMERALRGDETVVEYGSGQSTKWLAARVATIHTIEHDAEWTALAGHLPANAQLLDRPCAGDGLEAPDDDDYVAAIREVAPPDVVIVDGRARLSCVAAAVEHLAAEGLVLLDDSHRPAYAPALTQLSDAGFGRVDFVGPVPGRTGFSSTSVFSRTMQAWTNPSVSPQAWPESIDDP